MYVFACVFLCLCACVHLYVIILLTLSLSQSSVNRAVSCMYTICILIHIVPMSNILLYPLSVLFPPTCCPLDSLKSVLGIGDLNFTKSHA